MGQALYIEIFMSFLTITIGSEHVVSSSVVFPKSELTKDFPKQYQHFSAWANFETPSAFNAAVLSADVILLTNEHNHFWDKGMRYDVVNYVMMTPYVLQPSLLRGGTREKRPMIQKISFQALSISILSVGIM